VKIGQQILHLLLVEYGSEGRHVVAAVSDNLGHAIIVGGQPALREKRLSENAFHTGTLSASRRIGGMAAVTRLVVDAASRGLLRIESEFGVTFAEFGIATAERSHEKQTYHRDTEAPSRSQTQDSKFPTSASRR
jgi:hypothetical protein